MSDLFGIKEGDVKAAEAETVRTRKPAADRTVELEGLSPALRTYASENPSVDITPLSRTRNEAANERATTGTGSRRGLGQPNYESVL